MRGIILLVVAMLALAACSSTSTRRPNTRTTKTSKEVKICGLLPAAKVSELLAVKVDSTSSANSWCKYSGTANGKPFAIEVSFHPDSSVTEKDHHDKVITGVGNTALLSGNQLNVRVRPNESFAILDNDKAAGEDGMVKMAKELLPKL